MKLTNIISAAGMLASSTAIPLESRATNEWFSGTYQLDPANIQDGIGAGQDSYQMYHGDGSTAAGWPAKSSWVSFEDMFNANKPLMRASCANLGADNGAGTTDPEIGQIWNAIQSAAYRTNVDHRFILAIIMQESKGCVRVHTTANGVQNPGLMQDHAGTSSCNINGVIQDPCPNSEIFGMIYEGTAGTDGGPGLAGVLAQAGGDDAQTYYRAARLYNSGALDGAALGDGVGSTGCYAADVANRLTGWVWAESGCTL